MRTLLAAAGAAGFFAAFAFAGGPNDLKTSFTCSGRQCTLKVTNNSGQPQSSIMVGVEGGLKVAGAKSAGTLAATFSAGGKTISVKAGDCAVLSNGTQVNCTFASGAWAKGATKTVAIAAAAAVARGAAINVCPSNGGCKPTSYGAAPASTTTRTESVGADLEVVVRGPARARALDDVEYSIRVTNHGPAATSATLSGTSSQNEIGHSVETEPKAVRCHVFDGSWTCTATRLASGDGFRVWLRFRVTRRSDHFVLRARAVGDAKPDPASNNHDSQATEITRSG